MRAFVLAVVFSLALAFSTGQSGVTNDHHIQKSTLPMKCIVQPFEGLGDESGAGTTWDPWAPCVSDDDCPPGTFLPLCH